MSRNWISQQILKLEMTQWKMTKRSAKRLLFLLQLLFYLCIYFILQILTQAFLENTELIEKLADYINTEVSSKSASELDQTTIESIVQKTEEDPIVVKLLSELIRPDETSEAISDNQNPEFLQHEIL